MIQINKDWRIQAHDNGLCMTLENRKINKKKGHKFFGKERWEVTGYYSQLSHALIRLVDQEVMDLESLEWVVEKQKKLYELIRSISKTVDTEILNKLKGVED